MQVGIANLSFKPPVLRSQLNRVSLEDLPSVQIGSTIRLGQW